MRGRREEEEEDGRRQRAGRNELSGRAATAAGRTEKKTGRARRTDDLAGGRELRDKLLDRVGADNVGAWRGERRGEGTLSDGETGSMGGGGEQRRTPGRARARGQAAKSGGGDGPLASFSRKASTLETVRLYAQTLKPLEKRRGRPRRQKGVSTTARKGGVRGRLTCRSERSGA